MQEDLEQELQAVVRDGFLSDVREVTLSDVETPGALERWSRFPFKLYRSAMATRVLKGQLDAIVPGTPAKYRDILRTIMAQTHTDSFCYLLGGQVRDVLTGKLSQDIDFTYNCTAQDVASVCVKNMWTVKYKAIGPVAEPNYVLIGDEQTSWYMEGFSTSFNALSDCFEADFRQNLLFYDLTNDVILDKTGYGVHDIRNGFLRLSCAPSKQFSEWAKSDFTLGQKSLRYVKFVLRSRLRGKPLKTDGEESKFIVESLKHAFQENAEGLVHFWFGYVLSEVLATREGVGALVDWVCEQGGQSWLASWSPFLKAMDIDPSWVDRSLPAKSSVLPCVAKRRPSKGELHERCLGNMEENIKSVFHQFDEEGQGCIPVRDLRRVLEGLGLSLSEPEFARLAGYVGVDAGCKIKINDFVAWSLRSPP